MNRHVNALLPYLAATLLLLPPSGGQAAGDCLRCHGMPTLGYQSGEPGGYRDFHVDATLLAASSHGKLACDQCHGKAFSAYPHYPEGVQEKLTCLGCHQESKSFPRQRFEEIERHFTRSVHFQHLPGKFDCFSCHDAHTFLPGSRQASAALQVTRGNESCQRCHDRKEPAMEEAHAWLPQSARHLDSARCVECHTRAYQENQHTVLSAKDALRQCESCHGRDSLLKARLYKHRLAQNADKGAVERFLLNEAYVVGMTSHPLLDWLAILAVGGALAGTSLHGLARWLVWRRREGKA
ncbi:MAG: cytochrome c3 family protein [Magnetococcales bacterium]|nr:cytochrome c3 family protein [Magnetococcales bacterium]